MSACKDVRAINPFWDVLDNVEKRRNGLMAGNVFEYRLCRYLATKYRVSEARSFPLMSEADDAVVRENRLAVVSQGLLAIYDVTSGAGPARRSYERIADVVFPDPRRLSSRLPRINRGGTASSACVRWSPAGALLTTSGTFQDKNALRVFDTATLQIADTLEFQRYHSQAVFTHEHSLIDPAIIAIGSSLPQLILADLRSGNVVVSGGSSLSSPVVSIGWSPSDEHLIVAASGQHLVTWDKRHLSKPFAVSIDNWSTDGPPLKIPQIDFLDHNRCIVTHSPRETHIFDPYTGNLLRTLCHEMGGTPLRRKFALNRNARVLYSPAKKDVIGFDLVRDRLIPFPKGAHLYRVELILFNDSTKEIYSINGFGEAIVWTPFE
ncbi:unnamed protein product [Nesidiocoris tenuis]|uniref:WD repeat-containing protein 55 homolog n=1 Tax=Nesidiocoris tenuis TaxID=355587 RepID=A0A6H5GQL6_9HEMI|nr:unnamed protein product [Nesidiocoris tenuis]